MLELTKTQTTDEYVEIHLRGIPSDRAELVKAAIEKILDLAEISFQKTEKDDAKLYSIEEVFPDFHIGTALRGLRSREGLTQKQLGKMIGAKPSHISEMESGKRTIGKEMAKRLAKALRTNYKLFL
jgi:ribosome-binding protein aMBF1 (putative translation factor)